MMQLRARPGLRPTLSWRLVAPTDAFAGDSRLVQRRTVTGMPTNDATSPAWDNSRRRRVPNQRKIGPGGRNGDSLLKRAGLRSPTCSESISDVALRAGDRGRARCA